MQMLLVTVAGTQRSVDLQVPGELALSELLPTLLEICCSPAEVLSPRGNPGWQVAHGQMFLAPAHSLVESGVLDGAVLLLQKAGAPPPRPLSPERKPQQFKPRQIIPGQGTGGIGVRWSKEGFGLNE